MRSTVASNLMSHPKYFSSANLATAERASSSDRGIRRSPVPLRPNSKNDTMVASTKARGTLSEPPCGQLMLSALWLAKSWTVTSSGAHSRLKRATRFKASRKVRACWAARKGRGITAPSKPVAIRRPMVESWLTVSIARHRAKNCVVAIGASSLSTLRGRFAFRMTSARSTPARLRPSHSVAGIFNLSGTVLFIALTSLGSHRRR